jgi:asparagine synthase (glutamine-hydrolysing)
MCGVAGIYKINGPTEPEDMAAVQRMIDAQIHRGPDGEGIVALGGNGGSSIVLGHRRLSIIDLSPAGKQPMSNEDGTVWVTYNGEIYNFRELRDELGGRGHAFKSKTDTEVLVHGYEEWGMEGLLSRLRGMFAFALYDSSPSPLTPHSSRLFLAKDHEKLIFASEVRAVMRTGMVPDEKNMEALVRFLQLGSVPVPLTTIKDVMALPAGHYLSVGENRVELKSYWDLSTHLNQSQSASTNLDDCIKTTRSLLEDSIKDHLISDVPLGVFLSGGIDSSSLVALATRFGGKPLTTLSIVFEEPDYSEAHYARLMAERYKTDHREVLLRSQDFFDELPRIFEAMDQPTIDGVNSYFVSKAAKEAGLTVVLSGTGGDEVFLGYEHFKKTGMLERTRRFLNLFPLRMRRGLIRAAILAGLPSEATGREKLTYLDVPTDENYYLLFRGLFTPRQIQDLLGMGEQELKPFMSRPPTSSSLLDSFTLFEFGHYLQNQLLKDTDVMSMAHSIETRVPFLDHRLVEYVAGVPARMKLGNGMNKPLLVKAMGDDLPREIWDRPKMGFTFPFGDWTKKRADELEAASLERKTFDRKAVETIWDDYRQGRVHWSRPWATIAAGHFIQWRSTMRILVLLTDLFDAVGGIQTFNRALVKALDEIAEERGWTVTALVLNDRGGSDLIGRYCKSGRVRYRAFSRFKPGFAFAALREARIASTIILGHVHFAPLALGFRWLQPNGRMLLSVYGIDVWGRLPMLQRAGVGRVDKILSISAATRDQMISHNEIDGKRFDILPCTFDPLYDHDAVPVARKELSLPSGRMILSVARLDPTERYKGIGRMIEALPTVLKELPDAFYVVVGGGEDRSRLEQIAVDRGVRDKVIFTGWVAYQVLPSYYQACDVFALPSVKEGFGIVFLEAMRYAKPCIGVRAGAIPEVIEDGKTGFLAEPGDTKTLADCLIRLLSKEELRREMGRAGQERLEREFSFGRFRERLEAILCPV